jgi:UDP-2,3-diacylglucosamine hydrolase
VSGAPGRGDLVFIGDVHLDRDDPDLDAFLAFLDGLRARTERVVLMGDLFNLWIGRRDMEQLHHRRVIDKLAELRADGIAVRYVEGNRDYRIGPAYAGRELSAATDRGFTEVHGGRRLFAIHGDLVNVEDRQYRTWRRLSRSRLFWGAFNLVPARTRGRLADDLERKMRSTNLAYKQDFPEDLVRRYAAERLAAGHDAVVLGHFHIEKDLAAHEPSPPGRILVLPEWKGSRRHLRVTANGEIAFVDSAP